MSIKPTEAQGMTDQTHPNGWGNAPEISLTLVMILAAGFQGSWVESQGGT